MINCGQCGQNYWSHLAYDGKNMPIQSGKSFTTSDTPYDVLNYEFLNHDGREVLQKFLWENELTRVYDFKTAEKHMIVISNDNLVVWRNKNKLKL